MNENLVEMLNQFGGNKALWMIGAKKCTYDNKGDFVAFNFMRNGSQATFCKLIYNRGADTYSIEFYTRAGRLTKRFDEEYCDTIASTFSDYTGLVLTMPRIVNI